MAPGSLTTTLACVGACIAEMMSPAGRTAIEQKLQAVGPSRTVTDISAGGIGPGTRWDAMMIAIESGDAGWLRVAGRLRAGTDAGTTEALLSAVSTALRRNAPDVLALLGPDFRAEDICVQRMIEARPIDDKVFEVHTRNALLRVADPALRPRRDRCLAILNAHSQD